MVSFSGKIKCNFSKVADLHYPKSPALQGKRKRDKIYAERGLQENVSP